MDQLRREVTTPNGRVPPIDPSARLESMLEMLSAKPITWREGDPDARLYEAFTDSTRRAYAYLHVADYERTHPLLVPKGMASDTLEHAREAFEYARDLYFTIGIDDDGIADSFAELQRRFLFLRS